MGAAYFVVVDSDDPGFDITIDGKGLSKHSRQVNKVAQGLGFKPLEAHCSISMDQARDQMMDMMGVDDVSALPAEMEESLAKMPPEEWFEAAYGLEYAHQMGDYIRSNPACVKDAGAVLGDLDAMACVMKAASERHLKWHLQVDF